MVLEKILLGDWFELEGKDESLVDLLRMYDDDWNERLEQMLEECFEIKIILVLNVKKINVIIYLLLLINLKNI